MESLKQQWIYRSRRLLYSLNELEREAEESKLIAKLAVSERGRGSFYEVEHDDSYLVRSLSAALSIKVRRNRTTKEFLDARNNPFGVSEMDLRMNWKLYKENCILRHQWGEILRSNYDWGPDTSNSLKIVFGTVSPLPDFGEVYHTSSAAPEAMKNRLTYLLEPYTHEYACSEEDEAESNEEGPESEGNLPYTEHGSLSEIKSNLLASGPSHKAENLQGYENLLTQCLAYV